MALVAERPHNKHGSSVSVREGLKVNSISVCDEDNVQFITVELPGVVVHSVYKRPTEQCLLLLLGIRSMPHIVIGDFNSHTTLWGYTSTDNDGEMVELWAESNNLAVIHNVKLTKSFNSAIWKKGYNPDLTFASSNNSNICEMSVLDPIPHTQHHSVSVNPVIVAQPTTLRRRFNLKKADCEGFSADLDSNIEEVDAIPENYELFVEILRMASRKHIPRECRSNYITGLTGESKSLYEAYKKQYSIDNLTHNSRRACPTIRKLSNDPTTPYPPCLVNANQVAHQLLINGKETKPTKPKRPTIPPIQAHPFSEEGYRKDIAALKNNMTADILVQRPINGCIQCSTYASQKRRSPRWRQSKIIAIEPGKDSAIPKKCITISLLCHTYKLYERMILNKIVEQGTSRFQAREVMHQPTVEPDTTH